MSRRGGGLLVRLLSAVLFLPPFVLIVRTGSLPFFLFVSLVSLFATWEAYRLFRAHGVFPLLPFGLVSAEVLLFLLYGNLLAEAFLFLSLFFLLVLLSLIARRGASPFGRGAGALFILLYASVLPGFLLLLRELPRVVGGNATYGDGASFVLLLFLLVWGSDAGAYAVGRIAGRRPLAPSISPKKSVEGSVGGLLFAVGGALLAKAYLVPSLHWYDAILLGFIGSLLGQAGDLVESVLKREANVKDTAPLIPGHGGVLDRFDSVLLAAPFVYFYLRAVAFGNLGP